MAYTMNDPGDAECTLKLYSEGNLSEFDILSFIHENSSKVGAELRAHRDICQSDCVKAVAWT
jgi:hypothetical protein